MNGRLLKQSGYSDAERHEVERLDAIGYGVMGKVWIFKMGELAYSVSLLKEAITL